MLAKSLLLLPRMNEVIRKIKRRYDSSLLLVCQEMTFGTTKLRSSTSLQVNRKTNFALTEKLMETTKGYTQASESLMESLIERHLDVLR